MNQRDLIIVALLITVAWPEVLRSQGIRGITFFPERAMINSLTGDPTAHRFRVARQIGKRIVETSLGGVIPVAKASYSGIPVQIGIGASVHTRLDPKQSISVESADYFIDFLLIDIEWENGLRSRIGMGHTSHHLGDNEMLLQRGRPLDYSRDYAQLLLIGELRDLRARVYAGGSYSYAFVIERRIDKPWLFQIGLIQQVEIREGWPELLGAVDVKFRQESDFGSTQRYLIGLQHMTASGHIVRIEFSHQRGLDPRGQFSGERRVSSSVGLVFEF